MKTEQEIKKMKDEIQERIEHCNDMALSQRVFSDANAWYEKKRQYMAQYNILLEILK